MSITITSEENNTTDNTMTKEELKKLKHQEYRRNYCRANKERLTLNRAKNIEEDHSYIEKHKEYLRNYYRQNKATL
jgi:hypothetical protein